MSSQENALAAPAHRNHGLFSDHYLDNTLPATEGWAALVEEARPVRRKVREILAAAEPAKAELRAALERVLAAHEAGVPSSD